MIKTSIIKLQIVCPGCNNFVTISGISDFDICQNCGKNVNVSTVINDKMFSIMDKSNYMNGYLSGGIEQIGSGGYKLTYSSMQPYCEECFSVIDEAMLKEIIREEKPYVCKVCSHTMPYRKADSILKEFHGKIIGVLNDSLGAESKKLKTENTEMHVFKCNTCGAGLELTADTKRTIKCNYCDNENYLPDSIWTKLHPNKEVQPLFIISEINEVDLKRSVDYFLNVTALNIFSRHFENFIREYFEKPFVSESLLAWIKIFLSARNNEKVSFNMDITKIQKYYFENFLLGSSSHPEQLRIVTAEFALGMPPGLQLKLAEDVSESVRLSLAKNSSLQKSVIKKLQADSSEAVKTEAKKQKTGFFKGLFG